MKSQIKVKRREIRSCQKHTREIKYQFRDVADRRLQRTML